MSDFTPSDHKVEDVVAYLEQADDDERARVLAEEAEGKDRASVRDWVPASETGAEPEPIDLTSNEPVEFDLTEENAVLLLAAAAELGLPPDVVTTKGGRLQAPAEVVEAAGADDTSEDKD